MTRRPLFLLPDNPTDEQFEEAARRIAAAQDARDNREALEAVFRDAEADLFILNPNHHLEPVAKPPSVRPEEAAAVSKGRRARHRASEPTNG